MLVRRNLFCALLALMTYFVCFAHATWSSSSSSSSSNGQPQQDDDDTHMPLVIPLETRLLGAQNLQQLNLTRQRLQRLIDDCNSDAIVRAIRRPNIISGDTVKLRICLSLLDVLHNANLRSTTTSPLDEILIVE